MSETAPSISRSASMIRVRRLRSRRTAGPCSAFVQKSGLAMRFSISSSSRRPSSASKIPPDHACAGAHGLEFPLQVVKEHFRNSSLIMAEMSSFPDSRPPRPSNYRWGTAFETPKTPSRQWRPFQPRRACGTLAQM